ncbi:hypothetical protein JCM15765_36350 [Paradesulfitobacterium aromaticivorans]
MFMLKQRRHRNRSWVWNMLGIAGAFMVGREAGKRMKPNNHHHSSWKQDEGMGQE